MLFSPYRLRFFITRCATLLPSHQQKYLTARFISNGIKSSSSLLSLPNPPLSFTSKNDERPTPLSAEFVKTITDEFLLDERRRDQIVTQSRIIHRELLSIQFIWERGGNLDESAKALAKLEDAISHGTIQLETTAAITREGDLPYLFQEAIKLRAFHHFLLTGTLIKQSELSIKYHDDDYLSGIMSLPHQLARYAVGRAIARDSPSVTMARDVTAQIFECLLSFDFRNGPLRRRYDGVKYAVKNLELILYELSLKGDTTTNDVTAALERVNREEIEDIRTRLEQRDEMREQIIKRCRDSQKYAKQAIFALHRGDLDGGKSLISRCEDIVTTELLPIVEKDPSLRSSGSFTATLEEYAEAKLFVVWLEGDGRLASKEEMTLEITKEEYVGGLCDLTGEINRLAVAKATQRDVVVVKSCLATNLEILMMMRMIAAMTGTTTGKEWNKKIEQIQSSVKKMERMLYELSLIRGQQTLEYSDVSQLLIDDISCDEKN